MTVIVLAAGLSTRMGRNKLLLPCRGKSIIRSTVESILEYTERITVVTGFESDLIIKELSGLSITAVHADNYEKGQKESTLCGVEHTDDDFAVIPGDLPLITAEDFTGTEKMLLSHSISRAYHEGIPGHPVIFRREHREKLLSYPGTLKEYLASHDTGIYEGGIGCTFDIDTPERYRELLSRYEH